MILATDGQTLNMKTVLELENVYFPTNTESTFYVSKVNYIELYGIIARVGLCK